MPYIIPAKRLQLEQAINALSDTVVTLARESMSSLTGVDKVSATHPSCAALLNYTLTVLSLQVIRKLYGAIHYETVAILSGIFSDVRNEIFRRVLVPFENVLIETNGDLKEYRDINIHLNE